MRRRLRLKITLLTLEALTELARAVARWGKVPDDNEPVVVARYTREPGWMPNAPTLQRWLDSRRGPTEWN